jgi:hypothetical protein
VAEVAAAEQVVLVAVVQHTLVVQVILLVETQAQPIQVVVEDQMVFLLLQAQQVALVVQA